MAQTIRKPRYRFVELLPGSIAYVVLIVPRVTVLQRTLCECIIKSCKDEVVPNKHGKASTFYDFMIKTPHGTFRTFQVYKSQAIARHQTKLKRPVVKMEELIEIVKKRVLQTA